MTVLDRAKQRQILELLAGAYPNTAVLTPSDDETAEQMVANVYYLWQHDLVDAKWTTMMDGTRRSGAVSITAKGMDFLADDGGLSAILGVVTVKLHDDTIRKLLIERVEKAEGDKSVKDMMVAKIKELPAEALGAVAMGGLDAALAQAPNVLQLLRAVLRV